MIAVDGVQRRTRNGGSCALCDRPYVGAETDGPRGYRVVATLVDGSVEPVNLCPSCYEREGEL
jgi:hypothetical protein